MVSLRWEPRNSTGRLENGEDNVIAAIAAWSRSGSPEESLTNSPLNPPSLKIENSIRTLPDFILAVLGICLCQFFLIISCSLEVRREVHAHRIRVDLDVVRQRGNFLLLNGWIIL